MRLLVVRDGFSPDRLSAAGYAEYHPVATNLTAEGRGMNRRVDIVILGRAVPEGPLAQTGAQAPMPVKTPATVSAAVQTAQPSPAALKPAAANAAKGPLKP